MIGDSGLTRIYLATATADDDEMRNRIVHHRMQRGDGWITVEEPLALVDALTREVTHGRAVLVDCLTLWLSNLMFAERDPGVEARRLTRFLSVAKYPVVLVSNEVGLGLGAGNSAWPQLSRRPGAPEPNRRCRRSQCRVHWSRASALAQAFVLRRIGMSRVPVTVLTGFLGAGKTTLLRSLLTQADGRRIAVIVNEFATPVFDGGWSKSARRKPAPPGDIVELTNGCICCTVAGDFIPTMDKLLSRDRRLDAIVIETSGLALPQPLLKAFDWPAVRTRATVDGVVTVVDALALSEGRVTIDEDAVAANGLRTTCSIMTIRSRKYSRIQLACADLVVLSKSDLVSPAALAQIEARLKSMLRPASTSCAPGATWRRWC